MVVTRPGPPHTPDERLPRDEGAGGWRPRPTGGGRRIRAGGGGRIGGAGLGGVGEGFARARPAGYAGSGRGAKCASVALVRVAGGRASGTLDRAGVSLVWNSSQTSRGTRNALTAKPRPRVLASGGSRAVLRSSVVVSGVICYAASWT